MSLFLRLLLQSLMPLRVQVVKKSLIKYARLVFL
ncbi:hypothetical protein RND81_02G212300 [Saponaria officinalis]|uniref:Uncharacterized protein n=1 Tax=Saponaria officinalis TaxID=3572 RepID=A0AAW1MW49_SAPOF